MAKGGEMRRHKALWILLGALALLSPLGLLASGTAWGEWGREELQTLGLGFVPEGLDRLSNIWSAPFLDYTIPGLGASVGYILSAFIGIGLVALATWALGRGLARGQSGERK